MKKLQKIDGACAVLALCYASGINEDTTLRICKLCGFEEAMGMDDDEWRDAAVNLGLKVRTINLEPHKLRKFVKDHPTGLFLIGTFMHLFVLDNGVVIDPRYPKAPGLDRKVLQAWRVCR